jgi:ornithine cyclodeaminase/alanine dehydrogenase-like protein (mu-crystallin family)
VLVLSNDDVARLLSIEECMAALEPMYRDYAAGRALLSPRVDNIAPTRHPGGGYYAFKHMGGTWPAEGIQALRINSDVITHPLVAGKPRRVKQPAAGGRWVGLVLLFSTETGALLAMFPDGVMQRLRVGAASGLGLKHLAREDASTLALIGSGWQAGAQLMAARAVRRFRDVRVFSPRKEGREQFASEHQISCADTAEACVAGADVILAATSSMVRVIEPQWLEPGMHVGCIKTEEIDGTVLDRCDRVFVHDRRQAKQHSNVMQEMPQVKQEHEGSWWKELARSGRYPDLGELLSGAAPGRQRADEITCFANNVGTGLQFAAAGAFLLKKAREQNAGHPLPDEWFTEDVHP